MGRHRVGSCGQYRSRHLPTQPAGKGEFNMRSKNLLCIVIKTLLGYQDFSDEEDILRYVIRATFVCLFKSFLCKLFMIKMRTKHNETNRTLPGLSG